MKKNSKLLILRICLTWIICFTMTFFALPYIAAERQKQVDKQTEAVQEYVIEKTEPITIEIDTPETTQEAEEATIEPKADISPRKAENPQETPHSEPEPQKNYLDIPLSEDTQDYIMSTCEEYHVPFEVIIAMIEKESSFNASAMSADGRDYGLMQIRDVNHGWLREELGITDFLDEKQNILCGVRMISEYWNKYDDPHRALMCYNAGESSAKRMWNDGIYSTKYSRYIMNRYEELKGETS